MLSRLTGWMFAALALVGFAGSAQALQFAELTLNDCDAMGCEGSTLYLSVQEEAGGSWLVTYTINTDGYTGDRLGFNQIGIPYDRNERRRDGMGEEDKLGSLRRRADTAAGGE